MAKTVVNQLGQDDAHDYFTKLVSRISLTKSHPSDHDSAADPRPAEQAAMHIPAPSHSIL